jgi:hypothetical protein
MHFVCGADSSDVIATVLPQRCLHCHSVKRPAAAAHAPLGGRCRLALLAHASLAHTCQRFAACVVCLLQPASLLRLSVLFGRVLVIVDGFGVRGIRLSLIIAASIEPQSHLQLLGCNVCFTYSTAVIQCSRRAHYRHMASRLLWGLSGKTGVCLPARVWRRL